MHGHPFSKGLRAVLSLNVPLLTVQWACQMAHVRKEGRVWRGVGAVADCLPYYGSSFGRKCPALLGHYISILPSPLRDKET